MAVAATLERWRADGCFVRDPACRAPQFALRLQRCTPPWNRIFSVCVGLPGGTLVRVHAATLQPGTRRDKCAQADTQQQTDADEYGRSAQAGTADGRASGGRGWARRLRCSSLMRHLASRRRRRRSSIVMALQQAQVQAQVQEHWGAEVEQRRVRPRLARLPSQRPRHRRRRQLALQSHRVVASGQASLAATAGRQLLQ